jgi:hypothetical protein
MRPVDLRSDTVTLVGEEWLFDAADVEAAI